MFQYNDIELSSLSGNLIASFSILEQSEDTDFSTFLSVYINSLSSVQTPSEIYGFSTIIFELCSRFDVPTELQQLLFQTISTFLGIKELDAFIKIKLIQILETQICPSLPMEYLTSLIELFFTLFSDINLHNELFQCYSRIILKFPQTTELIFKNIVPIAIQSILESTERQSILFFFHSSISKETIEYYQGVIPVLLPILISITENEIDEFETDTTDLIEELFSIYEGDLLELLQQLSIQSSYIILLAFSVIADSSGKDGVDLDFLKAMIKSTDSKERYMAIRCVNVLTQKEFIEELIIEAVQNFADQVIEIQGEKIRLVSSLSLYSNFPIEMYFDPLFTFLLGEDPYLGEISFTTLWQIVKHETVSIEKLVLLVPRVLFYFNECLNHENYFDFLRYFSSLIQSLSFRLKENFTQFADLSFECLQKMSQIDSSFLLESLTPIAAIAKNTNYHPFLQEYIETLIHALQEIAQKDDIDLLKQMIDIVVNSISHLLNQFDLSFAASQLFQTYLVIYDTHKLIQIISGFYDLLNAFPQLLAEYGEQLVDLLSVSASDLHIECGNILSIDDIESTEEEEEEEDEIEDDEKQIILTFFVDLFDLIELIVRNDQTGFSLKMVEFVFQMIEFCQYWTSYLELRKSLLSLIVRLSVTIPDITLQFIQNHQKIKEVILFGLNSDKLNSLSKQIIDTFGYESF